MGLSAHAVGQARPNHSHRPDGACPKTSGTSVYDVIATLVVDSTEISDHQLLYSSREPQEQLHPAIP